MKPTRRVIFNEFKKYPPRIWNRTGVLGTNKDIIKTILSDHKRAVEQAKIIAPMFKASTAAGTAKKVYDFLYDNIPYVKDESGQDIKLPSSLVRMGTGDCKSNALFANSIFDALNIPFAYRFTSYDSNPIPTHVYSYISAGNNKIITDPVYKKFNAEKPFKTKQDFTKKDFTMRIRSIQGINEDSFTPLMGLTSHTDIGKTTAKKQQKQQAKTQKKATKTAAKTQKKAVKTAAKTQKKAATKAKVKVKKEKLKAAFKNTVKKAGAAIKKAGKIAKKGALTPSRVAFLGLIKVNFRGLATKLAKIAAVDPASVKKIWVQKFAGSYDQLLKQLNQAKGKKPFLGAKKVAGINGVQTLQGIGIATEAIVGLIAAATPILVAVIGLLTSKKENTADLKDLAEITEEAYSESGGNAAMDDYADSNTGGAGSGGGVYPGPGSESGGEPASDNSGGGSAAQGDSEGDTNAKPGTGKTKKKDSGNNGMMLAAAAAAALLLAGSAGSSKKSKSK